ncbi:hypothetical protein CTAYLR_007127 [Chrysophaeum taylorii]|uniref:DUS-like FMN-binding domain-containing protein n=1 Tax=Chrysophaeum taylorii TaxID=2483200 RepID=A0AAD7U9L4_9STRA|nr:hypothetical protein CTAYLR_007127 [Chrysophaeum taylorii]
MFVVAATTHVGRAVTTSVRGRSFEVAPMMDYTDRHFRYMFRLLSREATLYTEMIAANALVDPRGSRRPELCASRLEGFYGYDDPYGRTVLQLGGACPTQLGAAAELAAPFGYAAINLNCGCPSDRVAGSGCFGAALMNDAPRVAACCEAIASAGVPATVKCRVGAVDAVRDLDGYPYERLRDFVGEVARVGVRRFQVHARLAVLSGLSPDKNRKVPPLRPDLVARLVADFPDLEFVFNGQVDSFDVARHRLDLYDGVMVGRDACKRPWYWTSLDADLFGRPTPVDCRRELLRAYADYGTRVERRDEGGGRRKKKTPRRALLKPLLNLFHGDPGAAAFKRRVDALAKEGPSLEFGDLLARAADVLPDHVLDAPPVRHPPVLADASRSSSSSEMIMMM